MNDDSGQELRLVEWCFHFTVQSSLTELDHRAFAEALDTLAAEWAQERGLAIGGGYRVEVVDSRAVSTHRFGLCATRLGQIIAAGVAAQMMDALTGFCEGYGAELRGGWRPFTDQERGD